MKNTNPYLDRIIDALKEVELHKQGKLRLKTLMEFLNAIPKKDKGQ